VQNDSTNTAEKLEKRAAESATELTPVLLKSNPKNNYLYKRNIYTIVSPLAPMYRLHELYVLNIKNTHQPCHTDYKQKKRKNSNFQTVIREDESRRPEVSHSKETGIRQSAKTCNDDVPRLQAASCQRSYVEAQQQTTMINPLVTGARMHVKPHSASTQRAKLIYGPQKRWRLRPFFI